MQPEAFTGHAFPVELFTSVIRVTIELSCYVLGSDCPSFHPRCYVYVVPGRCSAETEFRWWWGWSWCGATACRVAVPYRLAILGRDDSKLSHDRHVDEGVDEIHAGSMEERGSCVQFPVGIRRSAQFPGWSFASVTIARRFIVCTQPGGVIICANDVVDFRQMGDRVVFVFLGHKSHLVRMRDHVDLLLSFLGRPEPADFVAQTLPIVG